MAFIYLHSLMDWEGLFHQYNSKRFQNYFFYIKNKISKAISIEQLVSVGPVIHRQEVEAEIGLPESYFVSGEMLPVGVGDGGITLS